MMFNLPADLLSCAGGGRQVSLCAVILRFRIAGGGVATTAVAAQHTSLPPRLLLNSLRLEELAFTVNAIQHPGLEISSRGLGRSDDTFGGLTPAVYNSAAGLLPEWTVFHKPGPEIAVGTGES